MEVEPKLLIQSAIFIITVGTLLWRFSSVTATMKEQIKTLFTQMKSKEAIDSGQDTAIRRIEAKTTVVDKNVAVTMAQTKHLGETMERVENKLDNLTDALLVSTIKK